MQSRRMPTSSASRQTDSRQPTSQSTYAAPADHGQYQSPSSARGDIDHGGSERRPGGKRSLCAPGRRSQQFRQAADVSIQAGQLSSAITYSTGAVAADANGFFHPVGDHAQTTFVVDGQPISDQQSKVFSTQIPTNALQGMELITGSPDAQFGDKSSLVVNATTRSGLGANKVFGDVQPSLGIVRHLGGQRRPRFRRPPVRELHRPERHPHRAFSRHAGVHCPSTTSATTGVSSTASTISPRRRMSSTSTCSRPGTGSRCRTATTSCRRTRSSA